MSEYPFSKISRANSEQIEKLEKFSKLLREENEKVNLLSRKDMDDVEYRHVALCAAIGEFFTPFDGARIADVGTGGGLPGIAMAILWPKAKIEMFDGVGKKIAMVNEMIAALELKNASAHHARIEEYKGSFDYAVGRSVCSTPMFLKFVKNKLRFGNKGCFQMNNPLCEKFSESVKKDCLAANGVLYFKGGDLEEELVSKKIFPDAEFDLQKFFGDDRFEGKRILHFRL